MVDKTEQKLTPNSGSPSANTMICGTVDASTCRSKNISTNQYILYTEHIGGKDRKYHDELTQPRCRPSCQSKQGISMSRSRYNLPNTDVHRSMSNAPAHSVGYLNTPSTTRTVRSILIAVKQ